MGKINVSVQTFLEIDEDSISSDPDQSLEDIKDQIKWAVQRVQQGYDERVAWSIDYYLNDMMPKWLTELKPVEGKIQGIPMSMYSEEELNSNEISKEADERAKAKWSNELDTIIQGFIAAKEIEENWIKESKDNEKWQAFNKGFDALKRNYFSLWD